MQLFHLSVKEIENSAEDIYYSFFFIELLLKFLLRTNGLKWLWAPAERCIRVLKSPLVGLNFSTLKVINDISFSLFAHMFLFLFLFLFVFLSN
jgi:hypothetical protein